MSRSQWSIAILALFIASVGCFSDPDEEPAHHASSEATEILHSLHLADAQAIDRLFHGDRDTAHFQLDRPFRQVSGLVEESQASTLQFRYQEPGGQWSDWEDVESNWAEDAMRTLVIRLPKATRELELRGGADLEAMDLYFQPQVVAPAHSRDLEDAQALQTTQQSLAPSDMVISRSQWNAVSPGNRCYPTQNHNRMTIHHTAVPSSDGGDPAARMRGMQQAHFNRGWCDIGYHFVVSQSGQIYQGRAHSTDIGAHTGGDNTNNLGISMIGDYDVATPPQVQLEATADIMHWAHQEHGIALNSSTVKGHGQRPGQGTSCPGANVVNQLDDLIAMAAAGGGSADPTPEPEPPPAGGCIPTADPDLSGATFEDFQPDATGHDEAALLLDAGITQGCGDGLFCPDCELSRSQMATFLVRAAGLDISDPPDTPTFDDVSPSSSLYPYVEAAYDAGITTGCGGGSFCPGDPITRAQAATMIHRAQDWPDEVADDAPTFDDVDAGASHFEAIETIHQRFVTDGCADGEFCPDDHLTRGQAAVFVARAYNLDDTNPCAEPGGCTAQPLFGTDDSAFADFDVDALGYDEAHLLLDEGITSGCADDHFCPDCSVTRGQMAAFLARAADLDTSNPPATSSFDDVSAGSTLHAYIEAAYEEGITSGCGGDNFCPNDPISRAQAATMIARTLAWEAPEPLGTLFDDVDSDSSHVEGIEALYDHCVTDGCGDGSNFCPNGDLPRSHAAIFVARAFDLDGINPCAASPGDGDSAPITEPNQDLTEPDGYAPGGPCDDVDPEFVPYCQENQDPEDWDLSEGYGEDDDVTSDDSDAPDEGQDDHSAQAQSDSGCAATGSPQPSPLALLLMAALGLMALRRRG